MPDRNLSLFGQRLRGVRLEMHLNQADFARLTYTSGNSQLAYEAGKTPPTITYLYRLAEHDIDIAYLLTGRKTDGSLDFEQGALIEMFDKLSLEGRQSLIGLLMELTGRVATVAQIGARAREARSALHEKPLGFRGPAADD